MKLISLEDEYDKMAIAPLYPPKSGCSSCGKKGININITNTANGNTASGNANNDNANTLTSSQPASSRNGINRVEKQPVVARNEPQAEAATTTLLNIILARLNAPRPQASTIETEKKPDNVKTVVKEREVRIPVERRVNYIKPQEITVPLDHEVPYIKPVEIAMPKDRIKTDIIEREVPRFFDRVKNKVLVIRANQPPAPPSFA